MIMSKTSLNILLNVILNLKSKYNVSWRSIPFIGIIQNIDRLSFNNGERKNYNISLNVFCKNDVYYYIYLDEKGTTEIICKTDSFKEILYQVVVRLFDEVARRGEKSPFIDNGNGTRRVLIEVVNENKNNYLQNMINLLNSVDPTFGIRYENENNKN